MSNSSHLTHASISHNALAWDRLASKKAALARPARDESFAEPREWLGNGGPQGRMWLPESFVGHHVLCLAAAGGKHGPLYAAAGAHVTVFDISPAMLELDRRVARERRIDLEVIQGSMDNLSMLGGKRFDVVIHPVSTCYVPDISQVFQEVAYVTKPDGIYISQHKSPTSLQSSLEPMTSGQYAVSYPQNRTDPLPPVRPSRLREEGTHEFIHSLSDILGGLCQAGFFITDFCEPDHTDVDASIGSFAHRATYLPPYLKILARRRKEMNDSTGIMVVE